MQALDKTIKSLTDNGIMVIMNNHMSNAGWCCSPNDGNGLWYNDDYPENVWLESLGQLTLRYKDNPMVIGNDLRNEVRADFKSWDKPEWGTEGRNDWRRASMLAGNMIHNINPDMLILIEGIFGGTNLRDVKKYPVQLNVPNKLVWSAHVYSFQYWVSTFPDYE